MEARLLRAALVAACLASLGAGYRTANFIVQAPTPQLAREIGEAAEKFRRELAIEWTGEEMPPWAQPCMLTAQVAPHLGAGGATSFVFDRGEVFGWRMTIQGSRERILDSVLPHEVTHTIFACHFREALPRWADEGACTTVEHASERRKQERMLIEFLKTGRGISFSKMFRMTEYPPDVMPLYSQGYSLARYLMAQGGKQKFLKFLKRGMSDENWVAAIDAYYGYPTMRDLQHTWLEWVKAGSPMDSRAIAAYSPRGPEAQLASATSEPRERPAANLIHREPAGEANANAADPSAAPLVPVPPAETSAQSDPAADWKSPGTAASVYQTPEVLAQQTAPQVRELARPQPPQHAGQVILQSQARPAGKPPSDASPPVGSVYR